MRYAARKNGEIVGGEHATLDGANLRATELGADEVIKIEVVRTYPRLLTEQQRRDLLQKIDLREYANMAICGDGLEIDRAECDFYDMPDLDFINTGFLNGVFLEDDVDVKFLREVMPDDPEIVNRIMEALNLREEEN